MNWHRAFLGDPDWTWSFPEKFQPQYDFKTEWWWWGGHVYDGPEKFSFHAVLFRFWHAPKEPRPGTITDCSLNVPRHRWVAQWAITRHSDGAYRTGETEVNVDKFPERPEAIVCGDAQNALQLTVGLSTPVLQGERGVTQKGPECGDASYHFSCPQSKCRGFLRFDGKTHEVTGRCWLDREIGSDMFGGKPGSWNWYSIMLENGQFHSHYEFNPVQTEHKRVLTAPGFQMKPIALGEFQSKLTANYMESPCVVESEDGTKGWGFIERAVGVLV